MFMRTTERFQGGGSGGFSSFLFSFLFLFNSNSLERFLIDYLSNIRRIPISLFFHMMEIISFFMGISPFFSSF